MYNQNLFTAGQFARLHHINKRTLHYYDQIGLFSPAYKGKNNYRYYTYQQSPELEMILTFRDLGMSIEEILRYRSQSSPELLDQILCTKITDIDDTIRKLQEIRNLLMKRKGQLAYCSDCDLEAISIVECPEEFLLIDPCIPGESDKLTMMEQVTELPGRIFGNGCGTMLSVRKILAHEFETDDYFFVRLPRFIPNVECHKKPAGKYLRAFCVGEWDRIPDTYIRMEQYAHREGIRLEGYSYEEGLNEMVLRDMGEYITQISILCK